MKVILKRKQCIGCGSCAAVCPNFFEMSDDGLSHLKDSKKEGEEELREIEKNKIGCAKEAAEVCPVQAIEII